MNSSICSFLFVGQLEPVGSKDLDAVVLNGLWLAEMTIPASARMPVVRNEIPGVGSGPTSCTSTPML